jgi:hypothetical protein
MLATVPSDITRFAHQLVARYGARAIDIARENTKDPTRDGRARDMAYLVLNEVEHIVCDQALVA